MDLNKFQRLISFVQNLEQKLSSVTNIQEKLTELMAIVTKTHHTILEELVAIKTLLNEEQQFESKSLTNLTSNEQQNDRVSLCSASSCSSASSNQEQRSNSATSKRSSNLKKSDPSSNRPKSPKSVTFSLEQKQEPTPVQTEKVQEENLTSASELIRENSDLIPELFKQHHDEVTHKQDIGFKLGNALTNVRIHEIESENGDYLRLLNVSNSDDYDLSGHFLQQNLACVPICRFRFPSNTIIRAGQTITIWCGALRDIEPQPPHVFVWKEQRRWETGPECVTILSKPTGQAIAWARSSNRISSDQPSGDILFVHSKMTSIRSESRSPSINTFKSRSRLSAFNFIGTHPKSPFAHPPSSPVHPEHQTNVGGDLRSQMMSSKGGISPLLTRPKSSPFASHTGCKQDLISCNYLRKAQTQTNKQTIVKT